jgi:hypothetical protein
MTAYPRTVTVDLEWNDQTGSIRFENPSLLAPWTELFGELIQFRIIDRNSGGEQRDFGRSIIEVWDEDNPIITMDADGYCSGDAPFS